MLAVKVLLRPLSLACLGATLPIAALAQPSYAPQAQYGTPYSQPQPNQISYPAAPAPRAYGQAPQQFAPANPSAATPPQAPGLALPAPATNGAPAGAYPTYPGAYGSGVQAPPAAQPFSGVPQSEWAPSPGVGGQPAMASQPWNDPGAMAGPSPVGQYPAGQGIAGEPQPYATPQEQRFGSQPQQPYAAPQQQQFAAPGQQPYAAPQQQFAAPSQPGGEPARINPSHIPSQHGNTLDPSSDPLYRVAVTPNASTPPDPTTPPVPPVVNPSAGAQPGEHPLMPALRWAREGLPYVQAIEDYSCIVHKRERVDGQLGDHQAMFCKIRHQPFSVYMYFLSPPNLKGQEVIYVEGKNNGNIQAHSTGVKGIVGTVSLDPRGHMAMRGNRYPITELGVLNLIQRLIEVGEHDANYGECDVQFLKAKISGRPSTCIQVHHPVARRNFRFHLARIYVDDELNLPIRFESYDWPARQGGDPQLIEEYTYQNLKINNGFTELDFDVSNPKYGFR